MKTRFYLVMAMIALSWMGCSQEEDAVNQMQMSGGKTINATIESITRSTVTDAGVFSWASGDAISVHDASSSDIYSYSGSGNGFTLNVEQTVTKPTVTKPTVAYYPANVLHTTDAFYLPEYYSNVDTEYVASTNAAMMATPPTEGNAYAFMHLGGVMRFNVKNVPTNANGFQFTAVGKNITGRFDFVDGDVKTIATSDGSNSTVSIWFKTSDEVRDMTFYVPMPVGTYGDYIVGLNINSEFKSYKSTEVTNTIKRKSLLLMPTFTYNASTGKLEKGGVSSDNAIDLRDGSAEAEIIGNAEVEVTPGTDADATATLNYTPATDGSSELSLSDGTNSATSVESVGQVVVATSEDATIASCDINTPSLTVELSAAEGTSVTYDEVTALTAQQTLVIGEGVTINNLVVKGGNVRIAGKVIDISRDENNEDEITYIIVEDDADIPNILGDGIKIISAAEYDLKAAISAGGEVTLDSDITLSSCLSISNDVTLNLNGHNLTATNTAIYVTGGSLTIEGDGVVSAANGTNQTAVWAAGGNVFINNGTFSVGVDDKGQTNSCIYSTGGTITINGGSFNNTKGTPGGGGIFNVQNSSSGKIVINKVDNVTVGEGSVIYEAEDVAKGLVEDNRPVTTEETLKAAIAAGKTEVTLGANIDLASSVVVNNNLVVNLNGKSIKCASSDVFVVTDGTLTINGEGLVYGSEADEGNSCAVWVNGANAKAIINNGTYKVGGDINGEGDKRNDCIYVGKAGGTIEIYGGVFEYTGKVKDGSINDGSRFLVNQNDAHATQLITIYGGTFHNFDPAKANTGEPWMTDGIGSFVAPGYSSVAGENGTYVVQKGIFNETALNAAIVNGAEITLNANMTIAKAITIPTGITATINLNGFNVTAPNTDAFEVQGILTINGTNGTEESVVSAGTANPSGGVCAVWAHNGGKVTINGGYYKVYKDAEGKRNDCIYAGSNSKETAGSIVINGGKFEYASERNTSSVHYNGDLFLLNCANSQPTSKITVNAGSFKNHVPSKESNGTENEVVLGEGKKVYNGETEVTAAHSGTTDIWYVVE